MARSDALKGKKYGRSLQFKHENDDREFAVWKHWSQLPSIQLATDFIWSKRKAVYMYPR